MEEKTPDLAFRKHSGLKGGIRGGRAEPPPREIS